MFFTTSFGYGDEVPSKHPLLLEVETKLRPILEDLDEKPTIEKKENSFEAKYKMRKYMVHGSYKSGKRAEEAHEAECPSYVGFKIYVRVSDVKKEQRCSLGGTIDETYWTRELSFMKIGNSEKELIWSLSYGVRTDKKLLEKIRKIIMNAYNKAKDK